MIINKINNRLSKVWQVIKGDNKPEINESATTSLQKMEIEAKHLQHHTLDAIMRMILENPWVISSEKVSVTHEEEMLIIRFQILGKTKSAEVKSSLLNRLGKVE